jgi:hypothetical protein
MFPKAMHDDELSLWLTGRLPARLIQAQPIGRGYGLVLNGHFSTAFLEKTIGRFYRFIVGNIL